MICVAEKRNCIEDGCGKRAHFNFKTETTGVYCETHKKPAMINVVSNRCEVCLTYHPHYGPPRKSPKRCKKHKKVNDIKNPKSKCTHITTDDDIKHKCTQFALYGTTDTPIACEDHKTEGMRNLVERECVSCGLPEVLNDDNICGVCDPEVFKRVYLAKQKMVSSYMKDKGLEWVTEDKQLEDAGACDYKKRPDFLFDAGTHFVIVEVDEHQHKGRACECEQVRMVNLTQALQLPTVFVRFNPDDYKPSKGHQVTVNVRMDELVRVVKMFMEKKVKNIFKKRQTCGAVYMYFDEDTIKEHTKVNILG